MDNEITPDPDVVEDIKQRLMTALGPWQIDAARRFTGEDVPPAYKTTQPRTDCLKIHDFGMRGTSTRKFSEISGKAHLTSDPSTLNFDAFLKKLKE